MCSDDLTLKLKLEYNNISLDICLSINDVFVHYGLLEIPLKDQMSLARVILKGVVDDSIN